MPLELLLVTAAGWLLVSALSVLVRAQNRLNNARAKELEAKDELISKLDSLVFLQDWRLIVYGKLACCGCGHLLSRHDDPDSEDGYGCRDCLCQVVHNLVDEVERDCKVEDRWP